MKSARALMSVVCGIACIALFSGCETERAACEREKRMAERLDEMQMELDGRMQNMNMEMASMRANPPVVVQQVPSAAPAIAPMPNYDQMGQAGYDMYSSTTTTNNYTVPANMQVDTISIEDDYYAASKRQQLEQLAASSRQAQIYDAPAPKKASSSGTSNAAKHIRVPVPVRTVQAALKEAGFLNGAIDGKVGKQTIAAITEFQRAQGLKADGVVGKQTWNLLYPYVPAGMSTTRLK